MGRMGHGSRKMTHFHLWQAYRRVVTVYRASGKNVAGGKWQRIPISSRENHVMSKKAQKGDIFHSLRMMDSVITPKLEILPLVSRMEQGYAQIRRSKNRIKRKSKKKQILRHYAHGFFTQTSQLNIR